MELMKRIIFLSIITIMFVSSMSACTQDKSDNSIENHEVTSTQNNESYTEDMGLTKDEQERMDRLEKGILLFGEGNKGGYYGTTVNSAYSEEINPSSIVVNVTIKNVRGEQIDLSELMYHLNDEQSKNSYNGKVLTDGISSEIYLQPNESVELNIAFEVSDIAHDYLFSIESSLDPINVHWKIDNLKQLND